MLTLSSHASRAAGLAAYIRENKSDDPLLKDRLFTQGDITAMVIQYAGSEIFVLTVIDIPDFTGGKRRLRRPDAF